MRLELRAFAARKAHHHRARLLLRFQARARHGVFRLGLAADAAAFDVAANGVRPARIAWIAGTHGVEVRPLRFLQSSEQNQVPSGRLTDPLDGSALPMNLCPHSDG